MAVLDKFLAFQYQEIEVLDSKNKTYLVQDTISGRIFRKRMILHEEEWFCALWKQMKHPNLVNIEEVYRLEDGAVVMEEYVNGRSLKCVLEENKTCSVAQTKHYLRQICSALEQIHSRNLVYRNLNPNNVMITTGNNVKLMESGAIRTTFPEKKRDTVFVGTFGYAAPEQFGFGQSDRRSDIYAVGVLLNVMLTGQMPWQKLYSEERSLQRIIKHCIQVDRNKRYQNVGEIIKELDKSAGGYYISKFYEQLPGVRSDRWYCKLVAFGGYFSYFIVLLGITKMFIYENDFTKNSLISLALALILEITLPCMLISNVANYDTKILRLGYLHPVLRVVIRAVIAFGVFMFGLIAEISLME